MYRENEVVTGMFALVAEENEIVAVNVVGNLNPEDLARLSRQFGVPDLNVVP
jgi:hypothetical protein